MQFKGKGRDWLLLWGYEMKASTSIGRFMGFEEWGRSGTLSLKVRYQLRMRMGKGHGSFKAKEGNNTRKKETK